MSSSNPSLTIHSNRLAVEIARPGALYRGTRFDWNGFITQVTLDGAHTFCVPESYNPKEGSGGIGLCNEFGNQKCIGYADARPGELFPKPGIGLLRRPRSPDYSFTRQAEIVQPFESQVTNSDNWVRFLVPPIDCRGYAFREEKVISVADNYLQIQTTLTNSGTKPIHTHEYCHNFMGIDRKPVSPNYRLRFVNPVVFKPLMPLLRTMLPRPLRTLMPDFAFRRMLAPRMNSDVLVVEGNEVSWKAAPDRSFFNHLATLSQSDGPQWELTYQPAQAGLSETDDFAPAQMVLWGSTHVISVEVYVDNDLEPGQSQTWTRRYTFTCKDDLQ